MKNPEEAIEKVLAGLRDAPVPDGMERRILRALEDRPPSQSHAPWRWLFVSGYKTVAVCGIALVACALMLAFSTTSMRHSNKPAKLRANSHPPGSHPSGLAKADPPSDKSIPAKGILAVPVQSSRPMHRAALHRAQVAEPEAHPAVSFPPPPLPLTRQERLLLRVVNNRPPVELAELIPARKAARDEQERVEFERFFYPPDDGKTNTAQ